MAGYRTAQKLISYIEGLTLGQGRDAGKPFKLHPWEKRFIRGAFSIEGDAALTLARGNGKTTLVAAIACATLDGPLISPMAETIVVASSFEQGLICFRHCQHFLGPAIEADKSAWRVQDSSNRASIENRKTGARIRVLGSDPRRAHGLAPSLVLADEPAQWPGNTIDKMLAALDTSLGKIPNSRMIWLGTRAASPDHPFEVALKQGVEYSQVHAAAKTDRPFHRRTWKRANPGLDFLPDLERKIRREAEKAKNDSAAMAAFRALRLNMGVSDTVESTLLDADTWQRIESAEVLKGSRYVLGLDLGQSAAMSAAAAYWPDSGGLDCFAVFPETPGLDHRGLQDGVGRLYVECAERDELLQAGHRVSDIGALLREVRDRWGDPAAIVCDRWREAELRQTLESEAFPRCPLVLRGMGYKDGGEDVRLFRGACLSDQVRPTVSLLLRSAMSGARVTTDPAGNSKLAKGGQGRRTRCRDDAAAAAILAVAEGRRRADQNPEPAGIQYAVL